MIPTQFLPLANHLWQSTLFAAVAGLLTLALRKNRAQTRYWLWLAASVKFLIPFSVLVDASSYFGRPAPAMIAHSSLPFFIEQASQPFAVAVPLAPMPAAQPSLASWLPAILLAVWALGFVTLLCSWWLRWRAIRAAVRTASPMHLSIGIPAMTSPVFPEPGVFGIRRPILLLPDGISSHLTPPQLEAILTHELCHVRRRDNLATAIHMAVEAVFWFHPLVWWLGARLMEERERACDEAVLRMGSEPQVYAEGILKICELYLESPLDCVAGVTGANLKRRIEEIMANRVVFNLNAGRKLLLATAGMLALTVPVVIGLMNPSPIRAQSQPAKSVAFEAASVKPHPAGDNRFVGPQFLPGGRLRSAAPVYALLTVAFKLPQGINSGRLSGAPDWTRAVDSVYDIEATGVIPPGLSDQDANDRMRSMLQSLLADRFKMKFHRETKELLVYALVVDKGGPKLQKSDLTEKDCPAADAADAASGPPAFTATTTPAPKGCHKFNGGRGRGLHARAADIADLAQFVENWTDHPVVDKTGLKALYKFDTTGWLPMEFNLATPAPGTKQDGVDVADIPSIFTLMSSLGLKMETSKEKLDVVVIDHIEKPTEN